MQIKKEWFEMPDIRRKEFNKSVWIPLRAVFHNEHIGKYGYEGYKEDFFGSGSLLVPSEYIEAAKDLQWMDVGIRHQHYGFVEDDFYAPADIYYGHQGGLHGVHPVLEQRSFGDEPSTWHLHQDFILTLGLKFENNSWLCPEDGFCEVARIKFEENHRPVLLEMKSEYLKDYLCARDMVLCMTSYFSRKFITCDVRELQWEEKDRKKKTPSENWEVRTIEIHEGGKPYGGKLSVFHMSRTDIDENDDIPDMSALPQNENVKSESWEEQYEGEKLYNIIGELWRNEIVEPGKQSPKVRKDDIPSSVTFIIDAEGNKVPCADLIHSGKWLWFKPEVIMALCHRRGGQLSFYTQQTGLVACSYGNGIHFGVNDLGLINVFAKDVAYLPEWQQRIWGAYNVSPEGGVSAELLASQARSQPADTQAPEAFLATGIEFVNEISYKKLGIKLFRDHEAIPDLLDKAHRFRAIDEASFFALAKDLARIIADGLDAEAMQTIVKPPDKNKWGSLKSLENLLASKINRGRVRELTAPFVGVYELRHADAHLPSSQIEESFELIKVDRTKPLVHQAQMLLDSIVSSIYGLHQALKHWPEEKLKEK